MLHILSNKHLFRLEERGCSTSLTPITVSCPQADISLCSLFLTYVTSCAKFVLSPSWSTNTKSRTTYSLSHSSKGIVVGVMDLIDSKLLTYDSISIT